MSAEQRRPSEADEALTVLRDLWRAQGQDSDALAEELGEARSCKRMSDIGFDAMPGADGADRADGAGDLRAAWQAQLKREGKLATGTSSVRDLVLGDAKTLA